MNFDFKTSWVFPFADDVTGVGLITKNKVISSEGAGQGKCNEEIEKKTDNDNYFTFVDKNIFGNNIFSNVLPTEH